MLNVTIELFPGGNVSKRVLKSCLTVVNDGTGTYTIGNYDVALLRTLDEGVIRGRVTNFPRQTGSPEALVILALAAVTTGRVIDIETEGSNQLRLDNGTGLCYNGPSNGKAAQ